MALMQANNSIKTGWSIRYRPIEKEEFSLI